MSPGPALAGAIVIVRLDSRLGAPDVLVGGLAIWVLGREFPDSHDFWDGNWLRVTVHCGGGGASVDVSGSIAHLIELDRWRVSTKSLYDTSGGIAKLECMEPTLSVDMTYDSFGRIEMNVSITPNRLSQRHEFTFTIDRTALPAFIQQLEAVLTTYPIRGDRAISDGF
jgi:hypothetical protein